MKLIDLLVQELPKRGGWPEGIGKISMHANGTTYRDGSRWAGGHFGLTCSDGWHRQLPSTYTNAVSREQYEAALAASKQPVWIPGELPPIGVYAEVIDINSSLNYGHGESGEVVAHVENTAVIRMSYGLGCFTAKHLRPAKSEAERKRDDAIKEMMDCSAVLVEVTAGLIYDAVASGEIKAFRLAD